MEWQILLFTITTTLLLGSFRNNRRGEGHPVICMRYVGGRASVKLDRYIMTEVSEALIKLGIKGTPN